jgi:SagB-type dehydrogenase family enzyme
MDYRLAQGTTVAEVGRGVALDTPQGRLPLALRGAGAIAALRAMADGGLAADAAQAQAGAEALPLLRVLADRGVLERVWYAGAAVAAVARPLRPIYEETRAAQGEDDPAGSETPWCLSRFAILRRDGPAGWALESPLGHTALTLHDPGLAGALTALAAPTTPAQLAARFDTLAAGDARALAGVLAAEGFAFPADAEGRLAEDADPVLRQWEVHDLYMHSRSRLGRHANPSGGLFPFDGDLDWEPRRKPVPEGQVIPLPRARLDVVCRADPPFQAVAERRQSVRAYGPRLLDLVHLGQFLDRAARTRAALSGPYGALDKHTYANGGASYELELYLNVEQCAGLAPGFYYYEPDGHALVLITLPTPDTRRMLEDAHAAAARLVWPQVVIHVAARFQRVQWKYRSISYAVVLRNTGALYQHFYMVATAMGLGPCGLGIGDAERFARVAGTDYLRESSVGDFLIGSP